MTEPAKLSELPGQVVAGLQASPALLTLALMNLLVVGGIFYVAISVNDARGRMIEKLIERCGAGPVPSLWPALPIDPLAVAKE